MDWNTLGKSGSLGRALFVEALTRRDIPGPVAMDVEKMIYQMSKMGDSPYEMYARRVLHGIHTAEIPDGDYCRATRIFLVEQEGADKLGPSNRAARRDVKTLAQGNAILRAQLDTPILRLEAGSQERGICCPRCRKSDQVTFFLLQTRGGDEGSTTFGKCSRCKNHWRCRA